MLTGGIESFCHTNVFFKKEGNVGMKGMFGIGKKYGVLGMAGVVFSIAASVAAHGTLYAATTPKISAGGFHSLSLKSDGTVWAWGRNEYGQLGNGSTTDKKTSVQVKKLSGVIAVAAGYYHSLAVKSDGTVWAWGYNASNQLGDGTYTNRYTPVQVKKLSGIIAVSAGAVHSLAVKSDGTVWAWGDNMYGQLGDGTTTGRNTLVQVSGLSGVIAVAGGYYHNLAVKSDGTVWAWGYNASNQLGDGTYTDRYTPAQVTNLSGVIAVVAGGHHSLAVKSDGTVWAWGWNGYGQLGDGTTMRRTYPVQVSGLSGVIAVVASGGDFSSDGVHGLAVKSDGTVCAWGSNWAGQLGIGTTTSSYTPVQVSSLSGVIAVAAGSEHSLALESDGTAWGWGSNWAGQLGDGTTTERRTPAKVKDISLGITTVSKPTVTTSSAADVTGNSAILNGSVNLNGLSSAAWFDYGTTTGSYTGTSTAQIVTGTSTQTVGIPISGLTPSTDYYYRIVAQNGYGTSYGSEETFTTAPPDTTAPSGSISINSGASHTNSGTVTVGLKATDESGVTGYYLSEGSTKPSATASGWTSVTQAASYSGSATYTLSGGEGSKTLYAWYKDAAGNVSDTASTSITLDTTAPDGAVSINGGALYTRDTGVTVGLSATDGTGVTGYYLSETSTKPPATDSGWKSVTSATSYSGNATHTFSNSDDGVKTLYAWYKDAAENVSDAVSATITLDTAAPGGTAVINGGASYTREAGVTVALSATDGVGVTGYYISEDASTPANAVERSGTSLHKSSAPVERSATSLYNWTSVTSTKSLTESANYTLTGGEGTRTVYAWYKDAAGNVSTSASDTIVLDSVAPTVTITAPTTDDTYSASSDTIEISGSASDATSGVSMVTWSSNRGGSGTATGTASWTVSGVSLSSGDNAITVTAKDGAGNTAKDTITVAAPVKPQIAAGSGHSVTLKPDGTVWAWGDNTYGQLGDGTTSNGSTPALVKDFKGVVAIAAGDAHTATLKPDGAVWSWGAGSFGQLGNGSLADSRVPVQANAAGSVFTAISAGYHTAAPGEDGTVWAWGWNYYGQLGDGTANDSSTPVQVKDFKDATAVSAGYGHTAALKKDGTVWTWGYNVTGQLGNGTTDDDKTPAQVKDLSNVTAVAAGRYHTVALKKDGTVWGWGAGTSGQLGNGSTSNRTAPVQAIAGIDPETGKATGPLGDITAVAVGVGHTVALKKDGTVWAWGSNGSGQLGDGTASNSDVPAQVKNLGDVTAIAASGNHTMALKKDGTVWTWGDNTYGQLGDGTVKSSNIPVQASLGATTTATPTPKASPSPTPAPVASPEVTPEASPIPSAVPSPVASPTPTPPQGEGSVYGSVYDAMDDEPIEGVSVSITGSGGYSSSTETDEDGYYEILGLAVGKFTLKYKMAGYAVQTQEVEVEEEGEEVEADDVYLEEAQPGTIVGTVKDKDGNAIKSATVTLKQDGEEVDSTKTGKKGGFEFDDVEAGDYVVEAAMDGYAPASEEVSVLGDGEEVEVELVLSKKGSISVTVKAGNKKIKGASVTLKKGTEAVGSGKTDKNGSYTFSNLDGGSYVVEVKMKKYADASQTVELKEEEEKKVEIELTKAKK